MDGQEFGAFITELRKEKGWTQRQLAEKLNVSDKAVSKWECGKGFPDIKMIEPLAEALGVSVLEIMKSERITENMIPSEDAAEALGKMMDVAVYREKIERRNLLITISIAAMVVMTVFLIDSLEPIGFLMVCLPVILGITGIFLLIVSWKRFRRHLPYIVTLALGILVLLYPALLFFLFFFAFALGGPVPN